jgi:hypothetical protein
MTTYYVATTGSDSAAGGTSTPWRTIQHAVSTAAASDIIKVRSGTYSPFTVTRNGLTIQPDTAATVIVQAASSYSTSFGTGSSQYVIRLSSLTSCAISGIRVQNAPNQWGAGIYVTGCTGSGSEGSRTISLTDIEADHNHSFGIYITGSSGVDVIRPLCYKNDTGMQISSSSSVYVEDPVLHDNDQLVDPGRGGNGIVFYRSHDVHLLGTDVSGYTGALIYNNRSNSTLYDLSHGGRDGGAFEFYESYNIEIEGIRGWANQNVLETGQGSSTALSSGIEIHNNIFYASDAGYSAPLWSGGCFGMVLRAADGGNVHHNTFYGLGTNTVYITATGSFHGSIAGLTVRDNIIFGGGSGTRCAYIDPSTPGSVVYDYNDQYNPAGTLGHRAGTDQVHGLNADPIFADRTTLDFRLSSTSTCIGAAHDASDLGAIPSGTPPSPPADPGDPPGSGGSPPTAPPPDDPSFSPSWEWRLALHAMDLDEAGHLPAVEVTYDNSTSGLTADEVQAAIDEIAGGSGGSSLPWFNVMASAYGAVNDGTTNDRAAINLAIAALNAAGTGVLYFPAGAGYLVSGGGLTAITVPCYVLGDGDGSAGILFNHASATCFTLSADRIRVSGLAMVNVAGSESAGAAIATTTGSGNRNRYDHLRTEGFYDGMDLLYGFEWSMSDCHITNPVRYGVRIANIDLVDGGDWSMSDCWFGTRTRNATSAIRQESAGGGKLVNVKINENGIADQGGGIKRYVTGLDMEFPTTVQTGVMTMTGCSIENVSGDAILITTTGTAKFTQFTITSLEIGLWSNNSGRAVKIVAAATGGITASGGIGNVVIDSCVFGTDGTARAAVELTNTDRVTLGDLQLYGFNARYTSSGDTNTTDSAGGTPSLALDDLTDVIITTPAAGEELRWNGADWINDAGLIPVSTTNTVTVDTGSPPGVTVTTLWGISAGMPYYDTGGAAAGEEAGLFYDPLTDHYTLIPYDF